MWIWFAVVVLTAGGPRRVTDDNGCNKGIDANNELDGEIVCTRNGVKVYEGVYAHGKRVGTAKTWRDDGKLGSVVRFENGLKNGVADEYDREGFLDESCSWKDDKKHGPCKLYGPEGKLRELRNYVQGEQRGAWTTYHRNGKVQETGALDDDGKRHGLQERFREDGSKEEAVTWVHGEKDGTERKWYANGNLERETGWKAGRQHGPMRDFHDNGQLLAAVCYQNGERREGMLACEGKAGPEVVSRFFPDGKPLESTSLRDGKRNGEAKRFDRSGQLKVLETFTDDRLDGPQRFYEEGKLKRQISWKAGKRSGLETVYFDEGQVAEEIVWADDQERSHTWWWMNGKKKRFDEKKADELTARTSWHDTGQKESELTFRAGRWREQPEGVERHWAENGTLVQELNWSAGQRHGTQKVWFSKDGRPASEEEWAKGVRLSRKEWDESGKKVIDERYNADGSRK